MTNPVHSDATDKLAEDIFAGKFPIKAELSEAIYALGKDMIIARDLWKATPEEQKKMWNKVDAYVKEHGKLPEEGDPRWQAN